MYCGAWVRAPALVNAIYLNEIVLEFNENCVKCGRCPCLPCGF